MKTCSQDCWFECPQAQRTFLCANETHRNFLSVMGFPSWCHYSCQSGIKLSCPLFEEKDFYSNAVSRVLLSRPTKLVQWGYMVTVLNCETVNHLSCTPWRQSSSIIRAVRSRCSFYSRLLFLEGPLGRIDFVWKLMRLCCNSCFIKIFQFKFLYDLKFSRYLSWKFSNVK